MEQNVSVVRYCERVSVNAKLQMNSIKITQFLEFVHHHHAYLNKFITATPEKYQNIWLANCGDAV